MTQEIPTEFTALNRKERVAESFMFGYGSQLPYSGVTTSATGRVVFSGQFNPVYLREPWCNGILITGRQAGSNVAPAWIRLGFVVGQTSPMTSDVLIPTVTDESAYWFFPLRCEVFMLAVHYATAANRTLLTGIVFV